MSADRLGRLLGQWESEGARPDGDLFQSIVDLLRWDGASISEAVSLIPAYPALSVALREALGAGPELRPWEAGVVELEARAWRTWWSVYARAVRGGAV